MHCVVSDSELVERILGGDQESFEEIVSRYEEKAFRLASRYTRNLEDAEEVLQDVFTTVFRKLHTFEGKSSFSSWLFRITVNAGLMKLRRRSRDPLVQVDDPGGHLVSLIEVENLPDRQLYTRELRHILIKAVSRLPEEYQTVFVLREVDGLTNRETGEVLGISVSAVKSRLHRARLLMRDILCEANHWEADRQAMS